MHQHHRRALRRGVLSGLLLHVGLGADRVVEDDDALGADLGAHELSDVAIEVRADRSSSSQRSNGERNVRSAKPSRSSENASARGQPLWTGISRGSSPGARACVPAGGS